MSKTSVFIDGQAGTTGLELRDRLSDIDQYQLLEIEPDQRKSPTRRAELLNAADVAVLCLPDDAAAEAVELIDNSTTRVLDASTRHRIADGWVYGLPELGMNQRQTISQAQRVTNPGCYPQGIILTLAPLIRQGSLSPDAPIAIHAVSGYSGGGTKLIDKLEHLPESEVSSWRIRPYGLDLQHKHLPEMQRYSGLSKPPLFAPSVGAYYKGMLVSITFPTGLLDLATPGGSKAAIFDALQATYAREPFINLLSAEEAAPDGFLDATTCNGSNRIDLIVGGSDQQLMVTARLDNLGKGAAGAAVQNLNLMCGLDEQTGLAA